MVKLRKAKRRDRPIPRLKKTGQPCRFLFFDTETYPIIQDDNSSLQALKLGVYNYVETNSLGEITTQKSVTFYDTDTFNQALIALTQPKQKLMVFAHNIAFDLMVCNPFEYFTKLGYKLNPPIQSGMRFLWKVKLNNGSIEFVNTGNYVPFSLDLIGKDLGYPKLDVDFSTVTDEQLEIYCKRDVNIVQKFVLEYINFLRINDLGVFRSTIASQALSTYRYRFMQDDITLHSNLSLNTIERDSYMGGRTEAFYIGKVPEDNVYGLDINSMYPHCMKQGNLPIKFSNTIANPYVDECEIICEFNYVIADCVITTTEPFAPIKWNKNNYKIHQECYEPQGRKLIFPIGTYRTYLHHDEFLYALQNNLVTHVNACYLYHKGNIFTEYVDFFNQLKIQAGEDDNQSQRLMAKLFLNSLYGKFAQLFRDTLCIDENPDYDIPVTNVYNTQTGAEYVDFTWYNKLYREYSNGESAYSFPAIAGAITARARMMLWKMMKQAGLENVYYCDTDSIYTNESGYKNLLSLCHESELGMLKLEEELSLMVINGAKDYIKDGKRVVKGVPKNAEWATDDISISLRFEGWKEWRNDTMERPPKTWWQKKERINRYDKRIVNIDGSTLPYAISNK